MSLRLQWRGHPLPEATGAARDQNPHGRSVPALVGTVGRVSTPPELEVLLAERGAAGIDHPGGTLAAHLERVEQRLAALGLPRAVQLAGRAHAVYGTDGFDVRLLGEDERPLLVSVIGTEAEALVHRYGGCDRARTWAELPVSVRCWDRRTGAVEQLDPVGVRDLADLSLVNELDVAEHAPGFLDQHGAYFRRLTASWTPVLSPSVIAAARAVFG